MTPESDTIAAIATPPGQGAVAVVRVSGKNAAAVLSRVFLPKKCRFASHRLYHGFIHDNGTKLDEVMAVLMRGPRSYTREDVAEIYTHGGFATVRGVLGAVLQHGARPAMPGEFTQRAFLRGRLSLTQAEAVMQLINAKTDAARSAGLRQLGGGLLNKLNGFRDRILTCLAHIELSIDYPEHEAEAMNLERIRCECRGLLGDMNALHHTAQYGKIVTEGLRTVIIGRPNVGKSSLMNAMLREDRAIVTEIPGTTRDVICAPVEVSGLPLLLSDTAGIREAADIIEKRGVDKSFAQADAAELILYVVDASRPPMTEDASVLEKYSHKKVILLLNKCDLPLSPEWERPAHATQSPRNGGASGVNGIFKKAYAEAIRISAKHQTGLEDVYAAINALFLSGMEANAQEADIITRERHRFLLRQSISQLEAALQAIDSGMPEDLVSVDLKDAYLSLNELVGAEAGDDVVERIFSEFCVGK
jgi:tRNA modification GTPase